MKESLKKAVLRLRRPKEFLLKELIVNGHPCQKFNESGDIDLSGLKGRVVLTAKYR